MVTTSALAMVNVAPEGGSITNNKTDTTNIDLSNDAILLEHISSARLVDLCHQLNIPVIDEKDKDGITNDDDYEEDVTKADLLVKLREYAANLAESERRAKEGRKERVEEAMKREKAAGGSSMMLEETKNRQIIVDAEEMKKMKKTKKKNNDDGDSGDREKEEEEDTEGYFYFTPSDINATSSSSSSTSSTSFAKGASGSSKKGDEGGTITRKTLFESDDTNDLTGLASKILGGNGGSKGYAAGGFTSTADVVSDEGTNADDDDPERSTLNGPFASSSSSSSSSSAVAAGGSSGRRDRTEAEIEEATERVSDLVASILATTGMDGFRGFDDDENDDDTTSSSYARTVPPTTNADGTVASFDPSTIDPSILTKHSNILRAANGEALRKAIDDFGLRSVGMDGIAGDDVSKGGGHYRTVRAVGAFLEGYRSAEVRKVCRSTVSALLDSLVNDDSGGGGGSGGNGKDTIGVGVQGLDSVLAGMTRAGNDEGNNDSEMELNDALLTYLDEIVREQQGKVEREEEFESAAATAKTTEVIIDGKVSSMGPGGRRMGIVMADDDITSVTNDQNDGDGFDGLWNVTTDKDGAVVETLDPENPRVQRALMATVGPRNDENDNVIESSSNNEIDYDNGINTVGPTKIMTPAAKLLQLILLLRERVRAEAAYGGENGSGDGDNSRSRNLRVLAYCLKVTSSSPPAAMVSGKIGNHHRRKDARLKVLRDYLGSNLGVSFILFTKCVGSF